MSSAIRWILVSLGVLSVAAVAARRAGFIGTPTASVSALPLSCRLLGHGWEIPRRTGEAPTRRTCPKCESLDIPLPR